jgi:phosphoenolpyruvate-protein kinase (PTS system EI component)
MSEDTKSIVKVQFAERDGTMVEVFELEVNGKGLAACETVFAILNSYPDEMFCASQYRAQVEAFRKQKRRSMSVGDVLDVDGVRYECADFGFKKLEVAS